MGEVTSVTDLTEFLNLNGGAGISAPDDGTKSFDVYATFTSSVTDNEQVQLTVNSAINPASGSSLFAVGDAGAAQTSIAGDANKIEVVATDLVYLQNTSDTNVFEPMNPGPSLVALDPNINLDSDFSDNVQVFATGATFDNGVTTTVAASGGVIEFSNLSFATEATGAFVTAFAPGFLNSPSNTFDIGPPLIVLASQDFDGSQPEWTYNNSVAFFNDDDPNNWGVNGYYGLIDASLASPLNHPTFSNNIVGENRLNSPPDGTDAFARINFGTVNVTGQVGVRISFDWQVSGYQQNRNDVSYNVIINGVAQGAVILFDGNGAPTEGSGTEVIDIPDGTTSVSLWIENRNRLLTGFCGFDNFKVMAETTNVLVYKDGNWYPNAPGDAGTEDVLISGGVYTVSSPIDVNEITINPLATMEVDPGQHVQTQGLLRNNGTLSLNSTSSLFSSIIPNSVENNGSINYSRFVNVVGTTGVNGGNDLISLPLMTDSQTFDEFITLGSPANSSILATNSVLYAFAPFNRSTNAYENFSVAGTNALTKGIGYRVATTSGENLTFSGDISAADVSGISVTKPAGGSQWNLIGNPYPSYVSSTAFISANAGIMDPTGVAIYGYNSGTNSGPGTTGNFTIINFVSNNNINIAPGQGFFIPVDNTDGFSGIIDFTADMRTVVGDNDFILTRTSNQENLNVRLKLSNNNNNKLTNFYFHPNGSRGLDPGYDAATFGNSLENFELYSRLVDDNSERPMMVQTMGMEDLTDVRIPLGVNASQGQQIKFSIDYSNIPSEIEIILEDTEKNTFTRLESSDYILTTSSTLSGTGRFYLNFGSNSLSTSEKDLINLRVYGDYNKQIHIEGQLEFITKALVYDLQGRLVIQRELAMNETQQTINASQLNSGIYLVKLDNGTSEHTIKIILK